MATDVKAKIKVEFDSDLQAAREALEKWKADRRKPRVCRGCKHLDDDDRCHRIWVVEELTRKGPYYFMLGFKQPESSEAVAEIDDPDDFGCNKWEAKP